MRSLWALERRSAMAERGSWLTDISLDLKQVDAFDVVGLVERLADLVEAGDPPFTISLSGSWGVGKSTVAEELRSRLQEKGIPGVIVDAWTEDIEHLRRTLAIQVGAKLSDKPDDLESVATKIDEALGTTENRPLPPKLNIASGSVFKNIREGLKSSVVLLCIDAVLIALTVCSAIWFPTLGGAFAAVLSACLIFTMFQSGLFLHIVTTSQSVAPASESVQMARAFKSAVTTSTPGAPRKVLVVVDNLDRLAGDDALRALAQIRALVEVPDSRAIFLIPIDRKALARHIQPRVGPDGPDRSDDLAQIVGSGEDAAADYLEKFFNLDLLLTRPDVLDLRGWALQEARRILPADNEDDLVTAVQVVCSAAAGSPRSVKRILNGVGARQRLLAPSAKTSISLSQLAFVESLATQFPGLISWLAPDGRRFLSLRDEITQEQDSTRQVGGLSKAQKDRLREFLLANSEIPITAPMTRLAMSLREDTVWKGVASPTDLQEALDTGQSDAFGSALTALDADDTERAIDASVSYIERSVPAFPRDAVSGLVAIGEVVGNYPNATKKLHPLAVRAFERSDHANRRRVTRSLGKLLFSDNQGHGDLPELARSFVETLVDASSTSEVSRGLVWTVRLSGKHVSEQQRSAASDTFSKLDDDLVAPLFEPPIDLWAVEGPLADKYVERLSTWEAASLDYPSLEVAIDRLRLMTECGWGGAEGLRQIAARAVSQLKALPDSPESFEFIGQLTALLRTAPPGDEVDQLATLLAASPGAVDPSTHFASVLRLPVRETARPPIRDSLTQRLQSASLALARSLVVDQRDVLTDFDYDPLPVLTNRWIAAEGREWAKLAVEFNGDEDIELLPGALAGASDNNYVVLVEEATGIAADRGDRQSGDALLGQMSARCSGLGVDRLADLGDALDHLQQLEVDLSPLVTAIQTWSSSDPAIAQLTHAVRALQERGIKDMRALAGPLAARGSAAGGILSEDVPWLVRCTNGSTEARRVAVRVIESSPVTSVCELANLICPGLRKHAEVNLALVRRAVSASTEEEATMLLGAALGWKKPTGDDRQEYRDGLTAVANKWPSEVMTDLVNRLQ
jgi:hypothetical protein